MDEQKLKELIKEAVEEATKPLYEKIEDLSNQLELVLTTVSTSIK